jgi:hypothetical protein
MKVFFVKIGRYTRRGKLTEIIYKVISTSDEYSISQVSDYFRKRYEGLEVFVDEVREIESLSDHPGLSAQKGLNTPCLCGFKIKYTEHEKKLHDEYVAFTIKAESSLIYLEQSISERYEKLFYSKIVGYERMYLKTDRFGTECVRLPIKANAFIKAAIDCNEGFIPELDQEPEIEIVEQEDVTDMPF